MCIKHTAVAKLNSDRGPIILTKEESEIVIQALSARATDEMRYRAWEILDLKLKGETQ